MKLLLVVPVVGLVFFAISAYKEIPNLPDKKIVPITVPEPSLSSLSTTASKVSSEPSGSLSKPAKTSSSSVSKSETMPPPPPPPSSSELKEDGSVVKEETMEESETAPFVVVEQMPMFPGGDGALLKYIRENTQYPESAKEKNIEGRVIIRFCVTAKGGVSRISVLKGVSPELDDEALRVVKTLPAFQPGKQGGKAVPVWYMVPISFALN